MFCLHGVPLTDPCIACQAEGEGNSRQPGPPFDIPGVLINKTAAEGYKLLRDSHTSFPSPLWMYSLLAIVVAIGKSMDVVKEELDNAVGAMWRDVQKPGGPQTPPEVVH